MSEIESNLGVEGVYVFELRADVVLNRPRRKFGGISRFPSVRRDFAVVVDITDGAKQTLVFARRAGGSHALARL